MGTASTAALTAARGRRAIRRRLARTPGRLQLAATLLTLAAIVFGVVAVHAAGARRQAVQDVTTTQRLLVKAVQLSADLSDAHATAAASFLVGEPEPAMVRRDYTRDLQSASDRVTDLASAIEPSSRGGAAVRGITRRLPIYSRLIDSARANFRWGYPVGSAYLREASRAIRDGDAAMLPAARELYEIQATKLSASYERGVRSANLLVVVLVAAGLLALLVVTQVYITRSTRRVFNVRLVLATGLLLGLVIWIATGFTVQRNALVQAQRSGSDPVELLTAARILASRAQAEESVALAARGGGGGEPRIEDLDRAFEAIIKPVNGLLRQAAEAAERSSDAATAVRSVQGAYETYRAAHARVVDKQGDGDFTAAAKLAVQPRLGTITTKEAAEALNGALDQGVAIAEASFGRQAVRATSALAGLSPGIGLLTAACALLALSGLRDRLEEYR